MTLTKTAHIYILTTTHNACLYSLGSIWGQKLMPQTRWPSKMPWVIDVDIALELATVHWAKIRRGGGRRVCSTWISGDVRWCWFWGRAAWGFVKLRAWSSPKMVGAWGSCDTAIALSMWSTVGRGEIRFYGGRQRWRTPMTRRLKKKPTIFQNSAPDLRT